MPPPAELPGFLQGVAPILNKWGYLAVAGLIGVESFGVPAPGQTLMVAAAIYAGSGRMNIFGVAAVAFVAAVLGDNVGYWIGVRGGRRLIHRFGKYVFITPERLEKAEHFFARRGNRIVLIARFIDGMRQLNGVIAGLTAMPWRTFLMYNAIGAFVWVGWWTGIAYVLGNHIEAIFEIGHRYMWPAIGVVVLAVATYAYFHIRHIRNKRAKAAASEAVFGAAASETAAATEGASSASARADSDNAFSADEHRPSAGEADSETAASPASEAPASEAPASEPVIGSEPSAFPGRSPNSGPATSSGSSFSVRPSSDAPAGKSRPARPATAARPGSHAASAPPARPTRPAGTTRPSNPDETGRSPAN
jgi:membrane protein DedA with SNARE-associated domain